MSKPIERIHAAAHKSTLRKLGEIVHVTGGVSFGAEPLLHAITPPGAWYFIDVRVHAIVGVQQPPRGAFRNGFAWRAAALAVEGFDVNCCDHRSHDWGPEAFEFWSNPIRCKLFPAHGAFRPLLLTSYDGAVLVDNGVHSLAVGLAWHLGPKGQGKLLRVPVDVREEVSGRISTLLALAQAGDVQFGQIGIEAERLQVAKLAGVSCPHRRQKRGWGQRGGPGGFQPTEAQRIACLALAHGGAAPGQRSRGRCWGAAG